MISREQAQRASNKECNPLIAIQSSPGGGKSFFLDEVGGCYQTDLDKLCEDKRVAEILSDTITIPITFAADMPTTPSEKRDPEWSVAIRVLYV